MTENKIFKHERKTLVIILVLIFIFVVSDLWVDYRQGIKIAHLVFELAIASAAATGIVFLLKEAYKTKFQLKQSLELNQQLKTEALKWKTESAKYIQGLSSAIDAQLGRWNLSASEKEIALLLLKGLSQKEIAEIRNTAEKTVRMQCSAIYQKSGLSGRSELAAFFLEDLLFAPTILQE